jgi:nucleotide-binding universal stress UspA family protein
MSPSTDSPSHGPVIVVGVVPDQPDAVLTHAAGFAERLGAHLVCASIDPSRVTTDRRDDGTVLTTSLDPDLAEESVLVPDPELRAHLTELLDPFPVPWSLRALAGSPAGELARLAEDVDAALIVVGTRESGIREALREFFTGSVAVQLLHHQHRPVLVIPLDPKDPADPLPWEFEDPAQ